MDEPLRAGRWLLDRRLGEGSQGSTWAATGPGGQKAAVKRFDVRGARAWKDVELAEREARVLAQLHHARLPAYVEHFEEDGALYLVMEQIDGESLAALRKRGAVLSRAEVIRFLEDAADVLDYLHGRAPPVIHRDIKPGNVIHRPDGSFALVDFGAVRDRMRPEGGSTVVGTFGYMAPEQFQGRALPASDVYAVGATALAMLTGTEPEALPHKGLAVDVRAALGPNADEALVAVLAQMLEPDPDRRPGRIAPLLASLSTPPRAWAPAEHGRSSGLFEELGQQIEREIAERLSQHEGELERFRARTEQWVDKAARKVERKVERQIERRREREERKAAREARRASRAARRETAETDEAREARRAREWRGRPPPWIGAFAGFHALQLVRLLLLVILQWVPTLILEILGRRRAADTVRSWHRDEVDGELAAAQRWLRGGYVAPRAEERPPAVRVDAPPERARVRVEDAPPVEPEEGADVPAKKRRKV